MEGGGIWSLKACYKGVRACAISLALQSVFTPAALPSTCTRRQQGSDASCANGAVYFAVLCSSRTTSCYAHANMSVGRHRRRI